MAQPERYEPLPSLLELPGYFLRKLSRRGRRTAIVLGVVLLATVVAGLAIGIPKIAESKREHAAADARAAAREHAARIAQLRAELRLVHGRGTPSRGLEGSAAIAARHALAADVASAVEADARERARTGEFAHPPRHVECERYPRGAHGEDPATELDHATGRYSCLAVTTAIAATSGNESGVVGYPYRALVDFPSGRFTFCKISGRPGEMVIPRGVEVAVPPACGGGS